MRQHSERACMLAQTSAISCVAAMFTASSAVLAAADNMVHGMLTSGALRSSSVAQLQCSNLLQQPAGQNSAWLLLCVCGPHLRCSQRLGCSAFAVAASSCCDQVKCIVSHQVCGKCMCCFVCVGRPYFQACLTGRHLALLSVAAVQMHHSAVV
jgi:hypothetical protein